MYIHIFITKIWEVLCPQQIIGDKLQLVLRAEDTVLPEPSAGVARSTRRCFGNRDEHPAALWGHSEPGGGPRRRKPDSRIFAPLSDQRPVLRRAQRSIIGGKTNYRTGGF